MKIEGLTGTEALCCCARWPSRVTATDINENPSRVDKEGFSEQGRHKSRAWFTDAAAFCCAGEPYTLHVPDDIADEFRVFWAGVRPGERRADKDTGAQKTGPAHTSEPLPELPEAIAHHFQFKARTSERIWLEKLARLLLAEMRKIADSVVMETWEADREAHKKYLGCLFDAVTREGVTKLAREEIAAAHLEQRGGARDGEPWQRTANMRVVPGGER